MASPRPYVAAAAAAVLAALYFVPSAHAAPAAASGAAPARSAATTQADPAGGLAETGMIDTKPYVIGGAVFLLAGAGLVVNATRRSRHALEAAEAADDGEPDGAEPGGL